MQINALSTVIDHLHDEDFPRLFVNFTRSVLRFDHALILAYHGKTAPHLLFKDYSTPSVEKTIPDYMTAAYMLDPIFEAHLGKIPPGLYRLEDLTADHFRRSSYYKSYYQQTGNRDELVILTSSGSGYSLAFSLLRGSNLPQRFTKTEEKVLRQLTPLLCALMQQHWQNFSDLPKIPDEQTPDPLSPRIKSAFQKHHGLALTDRQAEIIALILRGHSSFSIGILLGISSETVKTHRRNIYNRLRISSQSQLFNLTIQAIGPLVPHAR
ncbi:helix-turn-helix transcriptional regulator [Kiloniella laminariae]|uniref:helix-turn-helix transcriptional regulator n=1 Tax=Kiloniella laminariae TaxID=454162 RepID=UPI0003683DF0|nr:helix-turn-helix transcriptional regulator [Kiloniella laminariae]